MSAARRKAQTTQPETEAAGESTVPPREPGAPPGTGDGEPPHEPPSGGGSGEPAPEQPKEPAHEPFNLGDAVAIGATLALGLLLLVVFRGRRSLS